MSARATHSAPRTPAFEVRAVWERPDATFVSQPVEQFDRHPMMVAEPFMWGVYVSNGGNVEDHVSRAAAEAHAGQLNGERS